MNYDVAYWWRNPSCPRDKALIPGTNEVVRAGSVEQVWELWEARCRELGLTFENELAVFGDCCCLAIEGEQRDQACAPINANTPEVLRQKRLIRWSDIKAFFSKVAAWWDASACVQQEEADRRAAICAGCPLNQTAYLPGCNGCADIAAKVFKFIGEKKTASDSALKSCGHCGCQNSVIVWAPLDVLVKNEGDLPLPPEWCWKRALLP